MTSIKSIDHDFWVNPPWGNGREKYRLGLKPIEKNQWFPICISDNLKTHKTVSYTHLTLPTIYSV